ncbi:glycosyltransferase family 20 protein [Saccharata proteae CBS 121410]|uniref:Glycosyltransferase family 20 protein n=1 Tax=Saccharata proteae CBS 121410 TaxID=1314787 RepID=A0A9P4HS77_9PEZI|nr:glycosyltransferase family 20 protein [Saccharata proteae CBS 121410]
MVDPKCMLRLCAQSVFRIAGILAAKALRTIRLRTGDSLVVQVVNYKISVHVGCFEKGAVRSGYTAKIFPTSCGRRQLERQSESNPWNLEELMDAIHDLVAMGEEQRALNYQKLAKYINRYTRTIGENMKVATLDPSRNPWTCRMALQEDVLKISLEDRVDIVTGGASGLGLGLGLERAGWHFKRTLASLSPEDRVYIVTSGIQGPYSDNMQPQLFLPPVVTTASRENMKDLMIEYWKGAKWDRIAEAVEKRTKKAAVATRSTTSLGSSDSTRTEAKSRANKISVLESTLDSDASEALLMFAGNVQMSAENVLFCRSVLHLEKKAAMVATCNNGFNQRPRWGNSYHLMRDIVINKSSYEALYRGKHDFQLCQTISLAKNGEAETKEPATHGELEKFRRADHVSDITRSTFKPITFVRQGEEARKKAVARGELTSNVSSTQKQQPNCAQEDLSSKFPAHPRSQQSIFATLTLTLQTAIMPAPVTDANMALLRDQHSRIEEARHMEATLRGEYPSGAVQQWARTFARGSVVVGSVLDRFWDAYEEPTTAPPAIRSQSSAVLERRNMHLAITSTFHIRTSCDSPEESCYYRSIEISRKGSESQSGTPKIVVWSSKSLIAICFSILPCEVSRAMETSRTHIRAALPQHQPTTCTTSSQKLPAHMNRLSPSDPSVPPVSRSYAAFLSFSTVADTSTIASLAFQAPKDRECHTTLLVEEMTVGAVLQAIKKRGMGRYKFAQPDQGCRHWNLTVLDILNQNEFVASHIVEAIDNLHPVWLKDGILAPMEKGPFAPPSRADRIAPSNDMNSTYRNVNNFHNIDKQAFGWRASLRAIQIHDNSRCSNILRSASVLSMT